MLQKIFNKILSKKIKIAHGMKKAIIINPKHIHIGKNVHFGIFNKLACYETYKKKIFSPSIKFHNGVYIGNFCSFLSAGNLEIGENTLIASYVCITTENHGIKQGPSFNYIDQELTNSDVIVGKNCWIGEKVTILPGVVIGDNSIIGANSVVTKSIPSNCIAVGNPAKVIKKRNFKTCLWERVYD